MFVYSNTNTDISVANLADLLRDVTKGSINQTNFFLDILPEISSSPSIKERFREVLSNIPNLLENATVVSTEQPLIQPDLTMYIKDIHSVLSAMQTINDSSMTNCFSYARRLNASLRSCVGPEVYDQMRTIVMANKAVSGLTHVPTNIFKTIGGNLHVGHNARFCLSTYMESLKVPINLAVSLTYMLFPYYRSWGQGTPPSTEELLTYQCLAIYRYKDNLAPNFNYAYYAISSFRKFYQVAMGYISPTFEVSPYFFPVAALLMDTYLETASNAQDAALISHLKPKLYPIEYYESHNPQVPGTGAIRLLRRFTPLSYEFDIPAYIVFDPEMASIYAITPATKEVRNALYAAFPDIPRPDPLKPTINNSDILSDPQATLFPQIVEESSDYIYYVGLRDIRKYFTEDGIQPDTPPTKHDEWHVFQMRRGSSFVTQPIAYTEWQVLPL